MPGFSLRPALSACFKRLHFVLLSIMLAGLLLGQSENRPAQAVADSPVGAGADSPFGMNVQGASRYMPSGSNDNYSLPYGQAQNAGVSWTREEMGWHRIEPRPGQFDFSWVDPAINAATQRGISVIGLLDYNVDRSGGTARISYAMPDLGAWSNYVRQVVSRYKGRVRYWQIWNEPLSETYFTGHDPAQYARLLATSYDLIKSIDPGAQVLTAGFSPFGLPWMDQMAEAGGRDKFDIIAVHPYVNSSYVPGSSMSPESVYWATTDINLVMGWAARNGNKPVWATEFGWNTFDGAPNRVDTQQQANYLARAYIMGLASPIQKFFVYQFHEDTSNPEDRYGLLGTDWRGIKPAYNAYKNMVARLNGAIPQGRVDPYEGTGSYATLFDFNGGGAAANCGPNSGSNGYFNCFASSFANVNAAIDGERARSGQSLKLNYSFQSGTNDRYVTMVTPPLPDLRFQPKKIGFWAFGDATQTELRLLVKDSAGQLLFYDVGRMGPQSMGWQRYEAQLGRPKAPLGGQVVYPIKSMEIILDGWPKNSNYNGQTFIDDIYAEDSPPVYLYRYAKNGQTLDVVWADGTDASVSIPTQSGTATVYNRDGAAQTISATGGRLNLQVGDAPVYVEHVAAPRPEPGPTPGPGPGIPSNCPASGDGNLRSLFGPTWERYDEAITTGRARRSWMWGPQAFRFVQEPYDEAPGGCRSVLYWDKSRMEITQPNGNRGDKYFVTNGLLARELISGEIQLGNNRTVPAPQGAAQIPAAGDGSNNPKAPTYAAFARVTTLKVTDNTAPNRAGQTVIDTLDAGGNRGTNGVLASLNVRLTNYVENTRHNIADVFWQFMISRGPVKNNGIWAEGDAVDWPYSIGYPLSEPYWAKVTVGGVERDVLIQVFERRVLTYTPANQDGFKVEMGNIGGHYATWRYGRAEG